MQFTRILLSFVFVLFASAAFAAGPDRTLICDVGEENSDGDGVDAGCQVSCPCWTSAELAALEQTGCGAETQGVYLFAYVTGTATGTAHAFRAYESTDDPASDGACASNNLDTLSAVVHSSLDPHGHQAGDFLSCYDAVTARCE